MLIAAAEVGWTTAGRQLDDGWTTGDGRDMSESAQGPRWWSAVERGRRAMTVSPSPGIIVGFVQSRFTILALVLAATYGRTGG